MANKFTVGPIELAQATITTTTTTASIDRVEMRPN